MKNCVFSEEELNIKTANVNNKKEELNSMFITRESNLTEREQQLNNKEAEILEKTKKLDSLTSQLSQREANIKPRELEIENTRKTLTTRNNELQELIINQTSQLKATAEKLEQREKQFNIKFKALKQMEIDLKKKELWIKDRQNLINSH